MLDLRAWMDAEGLDAEAMASAVTGRYYSGDAGLFDADLFTGARRRMRFRLRAVRLISEVLAGTAPGPEHAEILDLAGVPQGHLRNP